MQGAVPQPKKKSSRHDVIMIFNVKQAGKNYLRNILELKI